MVLFIYLFIYLFMYLCIYVLCIYVFIYFLKQMKHNSIAGTLFFYLFFPTNETNFIGFTFLLMHNKMTQ